MVDSFPNSFKDLQIQEAQQFPSRINTQKSILK